METLRLAFVADRVAPYYQGGYERHLKSLSSELSKEHSVTVFSSVPVNRGSQENVRLVRIAPTWSYTRKKGGHSLTQAAVFAASSALRLPKLNSFDFVDVLGIPYLHILPFRIRQAFDRLRWGVTIWEAWHDYAYLSGVWGPLSSAAFRWAIRTATEGRHVVIVGSKRTAKALQDFYKVCPARIHLSPPGVVFGSPPRADMIATRSDCIFVGRLEAYKRVSDLLDAVYLLRKRGVRVTVEIVGEGASGPELRERTRLLGLEGQVRFHGFVSEEAKRNLSSASRVFVMPSEREGFSIATLEGIAAGLCPLVARPKRDEEFGVGDLIEGFERELAYPVGSVDALASALAKLLGNPNRTAELARMVRSHAMRFDIARLATNYVQMIRNDASEGGA